MLAYDQAELAQALIAEIGDALFLLDPDSDRLVEVNPVAMRLTGFAHGELLDMAATHLFRVETAGGLHRLRSAFDKTMIFHGQDGYLLRTRDGSWMPVTLTVSRIHLPTKTLGLIIARDDRERRAALAQSRRAESELRTVLANSPAALWSAERVPGPDVFAGWQFRYVSPLLARIAGRPAEFYDHPFKWAEAVHPADREVYRAAVRLALLTGTDTEQQYRIATPDGTVRWVRDRLQVVRDGSGCPVRLDGCVTDVTEQRQAVEAVRQSEERFRALVEKSRDGIILSDEQGLIRYASPAARAILGYDPVALVGRDGFELVHPDDRPAARERLADALARPGEDVAFTFRACAADGSLRAIEATGVNRLDDPSVRAIVVNYRDVTEREASASRLANKNALLQGLLASIPDILVYKDREGRFLGGNPSFEALLGRPIASVLGKTCDEVFSDEWAARIRAAELVVLTTGQPQRAQEWVNYPDGRKSLLDVVLAPLKSDDGATTGLIIIGRDVTEQERMAEELRQAHKMEAVGRLAGGIAHDFNNLLTVIMGNLELVRSGAAGIEADELLAASERAARQAADLTKQMLGFARRQPLRTTSIDLNSLAREAIALLRRTIDRRIEVRFLPADDLRPAAADPVQVQQVLMNLCLNARDAIPDGGVITVETANAAPPTSDGRREYVRLSVSDTGTGMTDDVKSKVFDPFFTTKGVGKGTGLGLAVVYGVAKAHGGCVEVSSAPGAGSRFDVYLPCGPVSEERAAEGAARRHDLLRGRGELVLIADDEPAVRGLARAALEQAGYTVIAAEDGARAVEIFRANADRIKMVVLDATMPRLSGRQAFEEIRRLAPSVPVLFATGYHGGGLPPEGATGTALLNKPYTPSQLATLVHDMLASA